MMVNLVKGFMILLFAGSVTAAAPCDSAEQYTDAFKECLNLDFESPANVSIFYASVYYQMMKDYVDVSSIPDEYNHIIADEDGSLACGEGIEQLRTCGEAKFRSCSQPLRDTVSTSVDNYRDGYCEQVGNQWQFSDLALSYFPMIGEFENAARLRDPPSEYACAVAAFSVGFFEEADNASCSYEGNRYEAYVNTTSFLDARETLPSIGDDVLKCIMHRLKRRGCSEDMLRPLLGYYIHYIVTPGLDYTFEDLEELLATTEVPDEEIRGTAVVFGDPHLIAYNGYSYRFMTCSGVGERLYLRNSFVEIYGENTPIGGSSGSLPPTFMTKIFILFKDEAGDAVAIYNSTQDASLPTTFIGGQSEVNEGSSGPNQNMARVEQLSRGIIRVSYQRGGVVVTIRMISNTLIVSARMSQSLFQLSTGDLATGCPDSEITRDAAMRKRRDTSVCSNLNLDQNYKQGCVFDVEQTGDVTLVTEFYTDINEVEEAAEEVDDLYINNSLDAASSIQCSTILLSLLTTAMVMIFY